MMSALISTIATCFHHLDLLRDTIVLTVKQCHWYVTEKFWVRPTAFWTKQFFYAIIIKFYVRIRTLYNALILIIRDMAP